jgi:hypothetical protein
MTLHSLQIHSDLATPAKVDFVVLTREMKQLMVTYSRAIEACSSVPQFSISFLVLYFRLLLWLLSLALICILGPIDIVLWILRRAFGRPPLILGRKLYYYFLQPFRSVWSGEIAAFKFLRIRYLTRLLLFYRANFLMNALYGAYNRKLLEILVSASSSDEAPSVAEPFQKAFELFKKITADSYRLEALAIGGPLVALLSLLAQHAGIPLAGLLWKYVGGPSLHLSDITSGLGAFAVLFVILGTWIVVSAWMDMRAVLIPSGVHELERRALAAAGLRAKREIPFDLLFFFLYVFSLTGPGIYQHFVRGTSDGWVQDIDVFLNFGSLVVLGGIAAVRRFYIAKGS